MRLSKLLLLIIIITLCSLFYVWQQTEILRLAYVRQKNNNLFQDLLDSNNVLRYNIERNASLVRIGDKISQQSDFQLPDSYRLVRLANPEGGVMLSKQIPRKENIISRLFGIKTQAEAKTINH
jgi:C4-dicarboxylate-specific signal transduction histidine kinase